MGSLSSLATRRCSGIDAPAGGAPTASDADGCDAPLPTQPRAAPHRGMPPLRCACGRCDPLAPQLAAALLGCSGGCAVLAPPTTLPAGVPSGTLNVNPPLPPAVERLLNATAALVALCHAATHAAHPPAPGAPPPLPAGLFGAGVVARCALRPPAPAPAPAGAAAPAGTTADGWGGLTLVWQSCSGLAAVVPVAPVAPGPGSPVPPLPPPVDCFLHNSSKLVAALAVACAPTLVPAQAGLRFALRPASSDDAGGAVGVPSDGAPAPAAAASLLLGAAASRAYPHPGRASVPPFAKADDAATRPSCLAAAGGGGGGGGFGGGGGGGGGGGVGAVGEAYSLALPDVALIGLGARPGRGGVARAVGAASCVCAATGLAARLTFRPDGSLVGTVGRCSSGGGGGDGGASPPLVVLWRSYVPGSPVLCAPPGCGGGGAGGAPAPARVLFAPPPRARAVGSPRAPSAAACLRRPALSAAPWLWTALGAAARADAAAAAAAAHPAAGRAAGRAVGRETPRATALRAGGAAPFAAITLVLATPPVGDAARRRPVALDRPPAQG